MKPLATLRRLQAVLALAVVAACATTSPGRDGAEGEDAPAIEIEVANNSVPSYDRSVYLLNAGGSRRLIGRVLADSTATLRFVRPTGGDQFRLLARPVGNGSTVTSPPFTLGPGGARWNLRANVVVTGR
ncbi:MAG TPA: hypothetical protein VK420_00720 [Longimicrobium sp.]|nr:hypothetical protein [Longimicrobium sp.]